MSKMTIEKSKFVLTPITAQSFRSGTSLKKGFSTFGALSRKTLIVALTGLAILSGVFVSNIQTTAPAIADPISDMLCGAVGSQYENYGKGTIQPNPETTLSGIFGLAFDGVTNDTKLTAYEKYGTSGTNFSMWYSPTRPGSDPTDVKYTNYSSGGEGGVTASVPQKSPYWSVSAVDCLGLTGGIENGIANFMLTISEFGVSLINTVYMVAFFGSSVLFSGMFVIIGDIVANFRTSLYLPFISIFVMLGALWMGYQGLIKRRTTEAFNGALWMIGSIIAGTLLLTNPAVIPQTADFIVAKATEGVAGSITDGASQNVNGVLCSVDQSITASDDTTVDPSTGDTVTTDYNVADYARRMQCAIWYNLVYTPWVVGQFGVSPNDQSDKAQAILYGGDDTATSLKDGIPITMGNNEQLTNDEKSWPMVQLNIQSNNIDVFKLNQQDTYRYLNSGSGALAYHELAEESNMAWTGKIALQRVTIASASIFATAATGILVLIFSFSMLGYQIMMVVLILLMPFFLLIGVHPGMGRRVAMRWLELIVNVTIKRIMISVLLSVFLLMYALVMGSGIWLIQNIIILAITVVGLRYKNKIMNMFADVDFGGDKRIRGEKGEGGGGGFRKVLGLATGAAVGAATAAVGAGALSTTIGGATAAVVGGTVAPAAAGAAATAAGTAAATVGTTVAAEAAGAGLAGAAASAAAPSLAGAAAAPAVSAAGTAVAPAGAGAAEIARAAQTARVDELRKKAIRQGALQGAAQGFASGNPQGAVLGAAMMGLQTGDTIHDNEVQRIENEKRQARDAETAQAQRDQAAAMNRMVEMQTQQTQKENQAQQEAAAQSQAQQEWADKAKANRRASTAGYDSFDPSSLPPRPDVENRKVVSEQDYVDLEAKEFARREAAKNNGNNSSLPPREG